MPDRLGKPPRRLLDADAVRKMSRKIAAADNHRYEDIKNAATESNTYISSIKAVVPSDPRVRLTKPRGLTLTSLKGIRRPPSHLRCACSHTVSCGSKDRTLKAAELKRLEVVLEGHAENEMGKIVKNGQGEHLRRICGHLNFCVGGNGVAQSRQGHCSYAGKQRAGMGCRMETTGLGECQEVLGWILRHREGGLGRSSEKSKVTTPRMCRSSAEEAQGPR